MMTDVGTGIPQPDRNERESSLYQFLPGKVGSPNGAEMDVLLVIDHHHARVCSELEAKLYGLLRETTRTAMDPALKARIWEVIGDE